MFYKTKVVLPVLVLLLLHYLRRMDSREAPPVHEIIKTEVDIETKESNGCLLDINKHFSNPQPLIIVPGTNEFYLPQNMSGAISLHPNEQLELFCSKNFSFPVQSSKTINVSCLSNNKVLYGTNPINFELIKCQTHAFHTAKQTQQSCSSDSFLVKIGFDLSNQRFLNLINVCYNTVLETTLYTHHVQGPFNIGFQRSVARPNFIQGKFFEKTPYVSKLFNKNNQKNIFKAILGHTNITKRLDECKQSLLVRGHLTPKVDFIFGSQQRATFWYINSAPQWESFNSGNWERIEQAVRKFVADRNITANIYTGTYGILTYYNEDGRPNEIYLSRDENNNGVVPVPKLFYKLVLSMDSKMGIVLIGVNNPFITIDDIEKEYVICDDVADQVTWIKWDRKNINRGYSYACEVNQFLQLIKYLPISFANITLLV